MIIHKLGDEATEVTKPVETPVSTPEETPAAEAPQTDLFADSSDVEEEVEAFEEAKEIYNVQKDQLTDENEEEKIIHDLDDTPALTENVETEVSVINLETSTPEFTTSTAGAASLEENKKKAREAFLERQRQVKRTLNDVKMKLRLPGRLADLENEPAYKRRNVSLDDVSHSSESSVSHFSINEEVDENGERKIELRDDNPFLHDNVD